MAWAIAGSTATQSPVWMENRYGIIAPVLCSVPVVNAENSSLYSYVLMNVQYQKG